MKRHLMRPRKAPRSLGRAKILDTVAVAALLTAFTIGDFQTAYAGIFPIIKWYVFIGFFLYSLLRNLKHLAIPRSTVFLCLLIFTAVATFSTVLNAIDAGEARNRVLSWIILLIISFVAPIPPHPAERLKLWIRCILVLGAVLILLNAAGLRDPAFYMGGGRYRV